MNTTNYILATKLTEITNNTIVLYFSNCYHCHQGLGEGGHCHGDRGAAQL